MEKKAGQGYRECQGGGRGFEIVNTDIGKGLTVKVVFEQRFEGDIRPNYAVKWEKSIPDRGED